MAHPDHTHTERLTARKREAAVVIIVSGPRCVFYEQKYRNILINTTWECDSFLVWRLVKGESSIVCLYLRLKRKKNSKNSHFQTSCLNFVFKLSVSVKTNQARHWTEDVIARINMTATTMQQRPPDPEKHARVITCHRHGRRGQLGPGSWVCERQLRCELSGIGTDAFHFN